MNNMKSVLLFLISILLSLTCMKAQGFTYPTIKKNGTTIPDFIPSGWILLDSASGDLNKDKRTDYALVLQHKEKKQLIKKDKYTTDTINTNPRILVILFRDSVTGNLQLHTQNNSFILTHDTPPNIMEDPYEDISISKGVLKIDFHLFFNMGSWTVTNASYKFRFQDHEFTLIGADYSDFHRASHEFTEYSFNFLTKKWSEKKGDDNNREKATETWHKLTLHTLKTLRTFKQPFTWEVTPEVTL